MSRYLESFGFRAAARDARRRRARTRGPASTRSRRTAAQTPSAPASGPRTVPAASCSPAYEPGQTRPFLSKVTRGTPRARRKIFRGVFRLSSLGLWYRIVRFVPSTTTSLRALRCGNSREQERRLRARRDREAHHFDPSGPRDSFFRSSASKLWTRGFILLPSTSAAH